MMNFRCSLQSCILIAVFCLAISVPVHAQPPCTRWIEFNVRVDEPAGHQGMVTNLRITLAQASHPIVSLTLSRMQGAQVPTFALLDAAGRPTRYCIPDGISGMLQGKDVIETTGVSIPIYTFSWTRDVGARGSIIQAVYDPYYHVTRLEIAASRATDAGSTEPVSPDVTLQRPVGSTLEAVALVKAAYFKVPPGGREAVADVFLLIPQRLSARETVLVLDGKLDPGGQAPIYATAEAHFPDYTSSQKASLVFAPEWLTPVRAEYNALLQSCGVSAAQADTITNVRIQPDAGCSGASGRWYDPVTVPIPYLSCRHRYAWIALKPDFDPHNVEHGDTLFHEWTHELGYVLHVQAPGGGGHTLGQAADDQNVAWDEAVGHFLGSHLTSRALNARPASRGIVYFRTGNLWIDTDNDRQRATAWRWMNDARPNPGSWVEDVDAAALVELYLHLGFDAEAHPEDAYCRFLKDLQDFCGAFPNDQRTGENFLVYMRNHVPAPQQRVVDQIALWYLIWTRQRAEELAPIDQLVPVRLDAVTTKVQSGQPATFKASALAFRRIAGQYRNYKVYSIRVHLTENGAPVGKKMWFAADGANPGYNFAAQLTNAWTNDTDRSVEHRVRAEVWGNFMGGDYEMLGRSDEATILVEAAKKAPGPVKIKKAELKIPAEVAMTEIFSASVELPPAVAGRATSYSWGGARMIQDKAEEARDGAGQSKTASARMQFLPSSEFFPDGKPTAVTKSVLVTVRDAQGTEIASVSADVMVKPAGFSGAAANTWEGDAGFTGVNLKRKIHKGPAWQIPGFCGSPGATGSTSSSYGEVHANWDAREGFKHPEEIEAALKTRTAKNGRLEAFALDDFRGFMVVTDALYAHGQVNCMTGFRDGTAMATGAGYVIKGHAVIRVEYRSNASGFCDDRERGWVEAQTKAIETEGRRILAALTISAAPNFVKTPVHGRPPGSPQPELRLVLSPDKKKLRLYEEIKLSAAIDNLLQEDGAPAFSWTGATGDGSSTVFTAEAIGKSSISVVAHLTGMTLGPETVEFEVIPAEVNIVRVSPAAALVKPGAPVKLEAHITWAGQPLAGDFTMRWEPLDEIAFSPQDSSSLTTTFRITQAEVVAVRVSVLVSQGGRLRTLAQSDTLEIPVITAETSGNRETGSNTRVSEPAKDAGKPAEVAGNYNAGGVRNNARCNPLFTFSRPYQITLVETYHWNGGRGSKGGTIAIKHMGGALYGPWPVKSSPGQGGAPDVYWRVAPNLILPAGTYVVIDSDGATWSNNEQSGGCGFARIEGRPSP